MSFYSKIRGTYETIFQIGKKGPQIKNDGSGKLLVRNSVDGAYANMAGLDPAAAQDFLTLAYFNANNAAANGLTYSKMPVALATKVSTVVIPDNAIIRECLVDIETGYDVGTTIEVKRTGGLVIHATGDNDAETTNEYNVPQITDWGAGGAGTVTVTVGGVVPAAGALTVYIAYTTPTDIS